MRYPRATVRLGRRSQLEPQHEAHSHDHCSARRACWACLMDAMGALEDCLEGTDYEWSDCEAWNPALVVGIGLIVGSLLAFAVRIWRRTTAGARPNG